MGHCSISEGEIEGRREDVETGGRRGGAVAVATRSGTSSSSSSTFVSTRSGLRAQIHSSMSICTVALVEGRLACPHRSSYCIGFVQQCVSTQET